MCTMLQVGGYICRQWTDLGADCTGRVGCSVILEVRRVAVAMDPCKTSSLSGAHPEGCSHTDARGDCACFTDRAGVKKRRGVEDPRLVHRQQRIKRKAECVARYEDELWRVALLAAGQYQSRLHDAAIFAQPNDIHCSRGTTPTQTLRRKPYAICPAARFVLALIAKGRLRSLCPSTLATPSPSYLRYKPLLSFIASVSPCSHTWHASEP